MNSKFQKSGIIASLGCLVLSSIILFVPHSKIHYSINNAEKYEPLLESITGQDWGVIIICLLTVYSPLLLILEATFMAKEKNVRTRILFIVQGFLLLASSLITLFIVTFHLFVTVEYTFVMYLMLLLFGIVVLWSMVLGIPFFDKFFFINGTFRKLSLIER